MPQSSQTNSGTTARTELVRRLSKDSVGVVATLHDVSTAEQLLDAHRAEVLAEGLSESERTFLAFALGLAADVMASRGDEFGAEDEAALTSLRAMAASAPTPVESAGDETGEAPVCPVCQKPGCCCSCFGKTPRPDCTHGEVAS